MVHARSRLFLFGLLLLALAGATSACNRRVNPAKATLKELFAATPKAHPPPPYEKIFPGMSTGAANLIDADLVPAGGGEHSSYVWETKPKVGMVEKKDSWRISVGED